MLVLSRQQGQSIRIGESIEVTILEVRDGRVRIGIQCPLEIPILRHELFERDENKQKTTRVKISQDKVEFAINARN